MRFLPANVGVPILAATWLAASGCTAGPGQTYLVSEAAYREATSSAAAPSYRDAGISAIDESTGQEYIIRLDSVVLRPPQQPRRPDLRIRVGGPTGPNGLLRAGVGMMVGGGALLGIGFGLWLGGSVAGIGGASDSSTAVLATGIGSEILGLSSSRESAAPTAGWASKSPWRCAA
jgi:hypothetical protein